MERDVTFLCLASYFKGVAFLEEAKAQGCKVILLTQEKHRHEAWPTHAIDETFYMPQLNKGDEVQRAVSYLARERQIDRIFPLAAAREAHEWLTARPGFGKVLLRLP